MAAPTCAYPLFAKRYLQPLPAADGNTGAQPPPGGPSAPGCASEPALSTNKGAAGRMGNLRVLDLRTLPRDDGPPTELRARKEKLAYFERQCSRVAEGLYVGAEYVARSREVLRDAGITHVINCVGFLYPPYFEGDLQYQTLYLQDTPGEDILCILYDVFDFIEAACTPLSSVESGDGRVLIHCSQGVSRSASLAIAYLMWKRSAAYDDVFQAVKAARGVANPNIGFICQLLQWQKRRHAPLDCCRLYRITPQSAAVPQYLVAKAVGSPRVASLDPRGAFVLQGPASLVVWVGAACPEPFAAAAQRFAAQLQRYEGVAGPTVVVRQSQEPEAFWASLAAAASAGEGSGSRSASPAAPGSGRAAGSAGSASAAELMTMAAGHSPAVVLENSAYDRDFELYHRSLSSRTSGGGESGADSARSAGRKTPREEGDGGSGSDPAASPNERLRKQARGIERPPSPGKRRREPPTDLTLDDLAPGISMDSAAAQLGKKERTLQEATSPMALCRAASDVLRPSVSEGNMTPRGQGGEEMLAYRQYLQQQQQSPQQSPQPMQASPQAAQVQHFYQQQKGWQRQASNLGRPVGGASAAAPECTEGGAGRRVPPINLRLALPQQQ